MVLNKSFKVLRRWRPSRSVVLESKNVHGESLLFESGTLNILTPAEVDYIRKEYTDVDVAYGCLGVLQGEGILYLVLITGCIQTGKIGNMEVYCITKTCLIPLHSSPTQNEAVTEMGKLLTCGQFYFSVGGEGEGFSLMSRAQRKGRDDTQFFWNRSLYVYLQRFSVDCSKWLIPIICGSVLVQTIYAGNKQVKVCLISRISCERTGTRFNVRGLDDEGHVANFVETEQVMYVDDFVASFVQVRGLVPIFWDQPGIQTGTNRIRLSRGYHSSHPAFERHYERLLKEYGPSLSLDLLGNRDMEPLLTEAFKEHIAELSLPGATQYVNFDYHLHCRPGHTEALESVLLPQCEEFLQRCGYYLEKGGQVSKGQMGVLRHNCLDCLDRSNNAQTLMGISILQQQLEDIGVVFKPLILARFIEQYKSLWVRNGDNVSRFYAGTKALDGRTKVGKLRDSARSVQRTIKNNFLDSIKQEAIDILLLNGYVGELGWRTRALLSPSDALAPLPVRRGHCDRWLDFTNRGKIKISVGTWNVNGGKHIQSVALKNQSLHDWLLDAPLLSPQGQEHPEEFKDPSDIYAIGFEELVGLTASNLLSTSSSNRHVWAAELQRVLSRDTPYSLLTAEQLVGVCLYIFVRPHLLPFVRDVAVSSVKTGIGGKAGNKGGVAIRFLLHSSSLCFVCAHFAAHQQKVAERNNDFAEICRKVQFPLGQSIDDQDYVFWCGDLNYRIDLPGSLAKDAIAKQEWDKLQRHEQLIKQRKLGKVFKGYSEGVLDFAPTFKYDMFSDDYDTSEKARIPAWCDRVLWRRKSFLPPLKRQELASLREDTDCIVSPNGEYGRHPSTVQKVYERELTSGDPALQWWHPGRLLYYGRTELKTSDHRPVLAVFEIDSFRVNERERKEALQETLRVLGPPDATVIVSADDEETNCIDNAKLVATLQQYGHIVLVRSTDTCTLVTFDSPEAALAAVDHTGNKIGSVVVTVKLKQPDYCFSGHKVSILTGAYLARLSSFDEGNDLEEQELEQGVGLDVELGAELEEEELELDQELDQRVELEFEQEDDNHHTQGDSNSVSSDDRQSLEDSSPKIQQKPTRPPPPPARPRPPIISRPPPPVKHSNPSPTIMITGEGPHTGSGEEQIIPKPGPHPPPMIVKPVINPPTLDPDTAQNGNPFHEELNNSNSSPEPHHAEATPNTEQPKPKPRTPPTRPPPIHVPKSLSSSKILQHPSKPPPKYAPKKPVCPPRTKPCSKTIDLVPAPPPGGQPPVLPPGGRPPVPKRPPPPYVSLYPTRETDQKGTQIVKRDLGVEPDVQLSDEADFLSDSSSVDSNEH